MKALFDQVSIGCSKLTTNTYSTSFSLGIRFLDKRLRNPIYAVYGFVRFADEIVDSFEAYQQERLLDEFEADTKLAIKQGISLNPILNSFQHTVNAYNIDYELIDTFLRSMRMDLSKRTYNQEEYDNYILGSAEVVGLMCLKIFVDGDDAQYAKLKPYAMKLGSAFQKINFLRDLSDDYVGLGRLYFPGVEMSHLNQDAKSKIEDDIEADFAMAYQGVKMLPKRARFGVFVAYVYFHRLFKKIKRKKVADIMSTRIRISNKQKLLLFCTSYLRHSLGRI